MTEQIMKILPAKKKCPVMFADTREFRNGKEHGFDEGVESCAAAIEKANLVRCPTEKQLSLLLYKHAERDNSKGVDFNVASMSHRQARAILALLRGEK